MSDRVRLAVVSFVGLYLELVLIRWLGAEVPTFEYFKHLPLLAGFIGMGLGAAQSREEGQREAGLSALLALVVLVFALQNGLPRIYTPRTAADYITWGWSLVWDRKDVSAGAVLYLAYFCLVVSAVFGLCLLVFRDVGRWLGSLFNGMPALAAYGINLAGSLAGIAALVLASFLRLNPLLWFALALIPYLVVMAPRRGQVLCGLATLCVVGMISGGALWTPYYRIDLRPFADPQSGRRLGLRVESNHGCQQFIMDLRDPALLMERNAFLLRNRFTYDLPYRFAPKPQDVLVLGAGCGNDVAAALRNGAARVDAVEIDPDTPALGGRLHPERPYGSPRVRLHTEDARAFLRATPRRYDLIVFGLLDAHILLATSRNIRLDNYLYTIESFRAAQRALKPGGTITVTFGGMPDLWTRIQNTMEAGLGRPVLPVLCWSEGRSMAFIAGPNADEKFVRETVGLSDYVRQPWPRDPSLPVSTDDWPFLYLHHRKIPFSYGVTFFCVTAVLLLFAWRSTRRLPAAGPPEARGALAALFLLGAAFMLVEVKAISQLALLYSSTWLTSAAVIASVLAMALAANMLVSRWKLRMSSWMMAGVVLSTGLGYFFTPALWPGLPLAAQRLLGSAVLALPVFFSGLLFSSVFRGMRTPGLGLAANLSGAFVGCLLENASMVWGVRVLNLAALGLYLAAWAAWTLSRRTRHS